MATFEISVRLASPVADVFDFFLNPHNRPLVSPPGTGLVIVKAPNPLVMGSIFEFKVQGMGLIQNMTHEIIQLEPNALMVERQTKGPLKRFSHLHRFIDEGAGVMTLQDVLEFEPPGGILGMLATEEKLLDSFEDGFYHRNGELLKRFGKVA